MRILRGLTVLVAIAFVGVTTTRPVRGTGAEPFRAKQHMVISANGLASQVGSDVMADGGKMLFKEDALPGHVNRFYFLLAPVVAYFLCFPKYIHGAMTLGEVTQSAAAFVTVQGAFNWLVDNYPRLAEWMSSAYRVGVLLGTLVRIAVKILAIKIV